jgi:hypothetical protein
VADPLVFVTAGIVLAALWRPVWPHRVSTAARSTVVALLAVLVARNAARWPAARAAATRLERAAAGSSLVVVVRFSAVPDRLLSSCHRAP